MGNNGADRLLEGYLVVQSASCGEEHGPALDHRRDDMKALGLAGDGVLASRCRIRLEPRPTI